MANHDDTMRVRARQLATEVGLFGGLRGEQVQFLTTVIVMFAENEILRRRDGLSPREYEFARSERTRQTGEENKKEQP